jgi:hypothetical protein
MKPTVVSNNKARDQTKKIEPKAKWNNALNQNNIRLDTINNEEFEDIPTYVES